VEIGWNVFAGMSQRQKSGPFYENILQSISLINQVGEIVMALNAEQKSTIITDNKLHEKDTGSSEVQIALISKRVTYLTEHFKTHSKDHHSRRGLLKLVSKRRKLLDHLKIEDLGRYQKIISKLGIRR
jgi:small subunit ribosomal protein S15